MLKAGDSFERYTIEAPIGQGGMGAVYRAHDPRLGRRVALKVIADRADGTDGTDANARLLREARAAAALDHPNAVSIFDVGELGGAPYIVMELVLGRTLRSVIGDGTVSLATRVEELADVARALAGAHRRGLIHRDIKPENVMVRSDDGRVKVLDFGIARRTSGGIDPHGATQAPALSTLTASGVKLGTPVYMAPEQIRGDALDGRADQFSWGVVAYELLAGRLPWRGGDALAVMASVLTDAVDGASLDAAAVPPAVQAVVLRALAKRPEDRFPSMDDVVRALEAALREVPAPASPGRDVAPSPTEAQRFSTGEIREVLGKALEQQAARQSNKLGFDDLLAVAAEVGVDAESLREATRALRASRGAPPAAPLGRVPEGAPEAPIVDQDAESAAWIRRERRDFYRHLGVYAIVNPALLVLGLVLLSFTPWWVWFIPGLAWAVGLAIHGLVALTVDKDDWKQHQQGVDWWHEQGRRRHEERMAAIASGHPVGRRGRRRVEVPEPPVMARVAGHAGFPRRGPCRAPAGRRHRDRRGRHRRGRGRGRRAARTRAAPAEMSQEAARLAGGGPPALWLSDGVLAARGAVPGRDARRSGVRRQRRRRRHRRSRRIGRRRREQHHRARRHHRVWRDVERLRQLQRRGQLQRLRQLVHRHGRHHLRPRRWLLAVSGQRQLHRLR